MSLLFASSGAGGPAAAGAWTLGVGETLLIATGALTESSSGFDTGGRLAAMSAYRKSEFSLYGEYGLMDAITLIARPGFADVTSAGPPAGAYRGFESLEAGARFRLAEVDALVFSAQAMVKFPGSSNVANAALVGMTAFEAEGRLLAGYSFALMDRPAFADAQIAWRARDGGNPGEARLDLTLGARPVERVQVLLQSFNLATTGAGTAAFPAQRSSKLQPSIVYDFAKGWSIQAGAFATVAAVNARRERGVIVALWRKF